MLIEAMHTVENNELSKNILNYILKNLGFGHLDPLFILVYNA